MGRRRLPFATDEGPGYPSKGTVVAVHSDSARITVGTTTLPNTAVAFPLLAEDLEVGDIVVLKWISDRPYVTAILGQRAGGRTSGRGNTRDSTSSTSSLSDDEYLRRDGTTTLTGDWNAGGQTITVGLPGTGTSGNLATFMVHGGVTGGGQIIRAARYQVGNLLELQDADSNLLVAFLNDGDLFTDRWLGKENNTFIGVGVAGGGGLAGGDNVFMGYQAGYNLTASDYNTAVGVQAGFTMASGITGNVFMGYRAGYLVAGVHADDNVATGYRALYSAVGAHGNIAIGSDAAQLLTEGDENVFIGYMCASNATGGAANVCVGAYSGRSIGYASSNVCVGHSAGRDLREGLENTYVGTYAGFENEDGHENTYIGNICGMGTGGDQHNNSMLGCGALMGVTTGSYNSGVGYYTLSEIRAGTYNATLGYFAAGSAHGGDYNVCVGAFAGDGVGFNSYSKNVFVGYEAGKVITTGGDNVFMGYQAGHTATVSLRNVILGYLAGCGSVDASDDNVAIGAGVMQSINTGSGNVVLGSGALHSINTGSGNVAVGFEAGHSMTAASTSILLGYQAGYNETNSNRLYIANSSTTTPLIYGEFDTRYLEIHGDLGIHTGYGLKHDDGVNNGYVLMANGIRYVPTDPVANPVALVGLTVVNGIAVTAIRSDGAPALDQGIAPTWTSAHTFNDDILIGAGKGIIHADSVAVGKVLIADGTRFVPGDSPGVTFANPTASVGLNAVNGVLTTAMRSDAAPPLDQGITPTWTAIHTFNNDIAIGAGKGITHADGVGNGHVLRADGTRYIPAQLTLGDLSDTGGFGTPALTLSTANAAGVATSLIRTDATIAVFDATVPTDITLVASATGAATVAARRDHRHGLDQSIAPTWAGAHTFNDDISIGAGKGIVHADGVEAGKVLVADGTRYIPVASPSTAMGTQALAWSWMGL